MFFFKMNLRETDVFHPSFVSLLRGQGGKTADRKKNKVRKHIIYIFFALKTSHIPALPSICLSPIVTGH